MRKILLPVVLVMAFSSASFAQSVRKQLEKADLTMYREQFSEAIYLYDAILEKHPNNENAQYHKLIAEHLTVKRGEDISDLLAFEDSKGHTDKFYNYWLGRVHYLRYDFHLAKRHFDAFQSLDVYKSKEILAEVDGFLSKIELANSHYDNPTFFEVEPLEFPINSKHDDLSPGFYKDQRELVFASSRPTEAYSPAESKFLIFHSKQTDDGWMEPSAIPNLKNLPDVSPKVEVTANEGKLFFFSQDFGGDLMVVNALENGWTNPVEFDDKIRGDKIESDFFINEEETHILFSSKRGGKGLDIYESKKGSDGIWSFPKPIKGAVNTSWNEDSPYLTQDGKKLFFSSDNEASIGGFDVFVSEFDEINQSWSTPKNMGFPINTIDDEINYQLNADQISGFLSSNRLHGFGGFDIYYFHKEGRAIVSGQVRSKEGEAVPNIEVLYHPIKYPDESFRATTNENGAYRMEVLDNEQFTIELAQEDQVFYVENDHTKVEGKNKMIRKNFVVELPNEISNFKELFVATVKDKDETEVIEMLGTKFRNGQKAVLKNIYFEEGNTTLNVGYSSVLDRVKDLLSENPLLNIEIGGHTDAYESEYADYLSAERAKKIQRLLISQGIDGDRITAVGYGKSRPLASNDDENEGRELNRRIEVRVLE